MSDARKAAEERLDQIQEMAERAGHPDFQDEPSAFLDGFEHGAEWQAARTPQITDAAIQRLREAFAAQLGSAYYPTIEQATAILEAALGQTNDTKEESR